MKIYLIHGWGDSPNSEAWFGWLEKQCKEKEWKLIMPKMPDTNNPKIKDWIGKLKEIVKPNEKIILIGHSIGCQTIMRYLEILPEEIKIKACIFVAPWTQLFKKVIEKEEGKKGLEIIKPWLKTPIHFEKIKDNCKSFLAFFSDNDPYVPLPESELFKQKLNAKIIIKENNKHFNETQEIPEIIEFIEQ